MSTSEPQVGRSISATTPNPDPLDEHLRRDRYGWYSWLTVDTVLDWLAENSEDPEQFATIRDSLAERLASKPEKVERSS